MATRIVPSSAGSTFSSTPLFANVVAAMSPTRPRMIRRCSPKAGRSSACGRLRVRLTTASPEDRTHSGGAAFRPTLEVGRNATTSRDRGTSRSLTWPRAILSGSSRGLPPRRSHGRRYFGRTVAETNGPLPLEDDQFTEESGVAEFNEQVWPVLRERGHQGECSDGVAEQVF
jgi:hypothetical protein